MLAERGDLGATGIENEAAKGDRLYKERIGAGGGTCSNGTEVSIKFRQAIGFGCSTVMFKEEAASLKAWRSGLTPGVHANPYKAKSFAVRRIDLVDRRRSH